MQIVVYLNLCLSECFQLAEAGLRELEEETGLHLTVDMFEGNQITPLAAWEVGNIAKFDSLWSRPNKKNKCVTVLVVDLRMFLHHFLSSSTMDHDLP